MGGNYRGSEQEIAERARATASELAKIEDELAFIRVRRRQLSEQLSAERNRGAWSPETKGLLLGVILALVVGPLSLIGLSLVLGVLFGRSL